MLQIAIEEWVGCSPIYTKRMQKALKFEGDDVVTIFKGLQLDIGAPPQFMDFRYTVHDRWHGEFHLDHCGALLDVEPMGEDYVRGMCHDIEDPTFDATAVATNRKAQIRPIHRPPRVPADRHPHCAWTVIIDESYPEVARPSRRWTCCRRTRAARTELDPIDVDDEGQSDYSGELLSDFDFAAFSHSALVRIADEVCLQMHLLNLSFVLAVGQARGHRHRARDEDLHQTADRHRGHRRRTHSSCAWPARRHRGRGPHARTAPDVQPGGIRDAPTSGRTPSRCANRPLMRTGRGSRWCTPAEKRPLQAVVAAVDPHLDVEVTGTDTDWTARVDRDRHGGRGIA